MFYLGKKMNKLPFLEGYLIYFFKFVIKRIIKLLTARLTDQLSFSSVVKTLLKHDGCCSSTLYEIVEVSFRLLRLGTNGFHLIYYFGLQLSSTSQIQNSTSLFGRLCGILKCLHVHHEFFPHSTNHMNVFCSCPELSSLRKLLSRRGLKEKGDRLGGKISTSCNIALLNITLPLPPFKFAREFFTLNILKPFSSNERQVK